MRLFILKMMAVCMGLVCVLITEGILTATLPMLGGLALLAVCGVVTTQLFHASVRRRRRARHSRPPQLRVVEGAHYPKGPKAA